MKLIEYLQWRHCTQEEFARQVGTSGPTVSRWVTGARKPGWDFRRKIEDVTDENVTERDFRPTG